MEQFSVVADVYMAKKKDTILITCNVNQRDLYNSIADDLHKMYHLSL